MKNILLTLLTLAAAIVPGACGNSGTTEYLTTTSTTTSTVTATSTLNSTSTLTFTKTVIPSETGIYAPPEWGTIRLPAEGDLYERDFYFQRIPRDVTEAIIFQGVVFTPQSHEGATIIAPINYDFMVQFPDGSIERIIQGGVGMVNQISISLTEHNNPRAGVMAAWTDFNLPPSIFLLVSESPDTYQNPIEIVSVTGPLEPINPGGPIVNITLKNISGEPVTSLTATLGAGREFEFIFDVSPSNPLPPGGTASLTRTLIGGGFGSGATLTISGTMQNGELFIFTETAQIEHP